MKYLYGSLTFFFCFIFVLWLSAPYQNIAESTIRKAAGDSLIYQSIKASATGASLKGVSCQGVQIGDISISYSPVSLATGRIGLELASEKLSMQSPLGLIEFQNVTAEGSYSKGVLTVKKLTSDDAMKLDLTGSISINQSNPRKSLLDIKGTLNFLGSEKNITLKGPADRVQPLIR